MSPDLRSIARQPSTMTCAFNRVGASSVLCAWVPLTGMPNRSPACKFDVPAHSADVSRARRAQTTVDALSASQTKFNYRSVLCGETDARGFGRNQALEIQNVEQSRFQELTLE